MTIWKTICSLVHPKAPATLSIFVPGFVRKIICNFLGLVHRFRGERASAAMSISPTGQQDLEQLMKLCDPPTKELEEILIESTNAAESQTGCKVEEPKASGYTYHCRICDDNCDHSTETCPDRSGKFITVCRVCDCLPCKNEADHKEDHYEDLLFCHLCNTIGEHLTEMCPDMDSDMGDEDWGSDMDDESRDEKGDFPENTHSAANAA